MFITESYGRQVVPFLLETVHEEPDEKVLMIGHCFNPQCNEELRYLRQGSVYQW
jgi:hypothetical protein